MEYRQTLIEAVNYLNDIKTDLFSKVINIEMHGDLKDINEVFDIGEVYEFNIEHLKSSTDTNVKDLTALLKNIDTTIDRLINLNNIKENEL